VHDPADLLHLAQRLEEHAERLRSQGYVPEHHLVVDLREAATALTDIGNAD